MLKDKFSYSFTACSGEKLAYASGYRVVTRKMEAVRSSENVVTVCIHDHTALRPASPLSASLYNFVRDLILKSQKRERCDSFRLSWRQNSLMLSLSAASHYQISLQQVRRR